MRLRHNKSWGQGVAARPVNFRLDADIYTRFEAVAKASRRSKTSVIEECIEKALPEIERRYKALAKAA